MTLKSLAIALIFTVPLAAQDPPADPVADLQKAIEELTNLKISGYVQAQYRDEFEVRRARLKLTHQLARTSRLVLEAGFTSSGASLTDGYIELVEPWTGQKTTLTAGQFKYPFGFEIPYSSSAREVPERARVLRALFPGERDRGVVVSGTPIRDRLTYTVGVVNGTGIGGATALEQDSDVIARLAYRTGPLNVGASIYSGDTRIATQYAPGGTDFDRNRAGVDVQWRTPLRGFTMRGEYVRGTRTPPAGTARTESHEADGWYVYGLQSIGKRQTIAVRIDEYDADNDVAGDAIRTLTGSYIFQWDPHSRVMAAYEIPTRESDRRGDETFTLRYQYRF